VTATAIVIHAPRWSGDTAVRAIVRTAAATMIVVEAIVEEMRDRASVGKDGVSREGAEGDTDDLDREDAPPQIEGHHVNRRLGLFS
jgi:hypothetical protein